jgi:hypothetical protein
MLGQNMSLIKTTKWAAGIGSRLLLDVTKWTLLKIECMGESDLCKGAKDVATMDSIFKKMDLSENKDHIHHDNDTV